MICCDDTLWKYMYSYKIIIDTIVNFHSVGVSGVYFISIIRIETVDFEAMNTKIY